MQCLAMDFGGSSVKTALADETGCLRKRRKIAAPLESREQFVSTVTEVYRNLDTKVDGIAISIPGYVDADEGKLKGSGMYRKLWGENIPDLLKHLEVPVTVENDGNCGALSEVWTGALKGCRDAAVLILGSGIGGGIIKNGRVHHGKGFSSGEVSYMILNPGNYGFMNSTVFHVGMIGMTYKMCLAKHLDLSVQDASETLIEINRTNEGSTLRPGEGNPVRADGKQMFRWLEEGDREIEKIYQCFIQNLAAMINNIQVTYAPEKIAIGGGLSLQKRVLDDLRQELEAYYRSMGIDSVLHAEVVPCRFLDETNLLGAAYQFMLKNAFNE